MTARGDTNARWSLQIDGFDIVFINASPVHGVNISVYDEDPAQTYLRFDTHLPVTPLPDTAERRFARLSVRRSGRGL